MNWIALFIKLLPTIVEIAEKIFNKPKAGEEKKNWVMSIAESGMRGADQAFTGGALETWNAIKPSVSRAIDLTAGQLFPSSPGTAQSLIDAQR